MRELLCLFVVLLCLAVVYGQTESDSSSTTTTTTTSRPTLTPELDCALGNKSCEECVARGPQCLYCSSRPVKCVPYPTGSIIPPGSYCPLADARWGVCWVDYQILLIVMGCLAAILLLTCGCCIVCCCCCKKSSARQRKKYQKEEARMEQESQERAARHAERRAERQTRMDEIRQKYALNDKGLVKDGNRYQKFEDEA